MPTTPHIPLDDQYNVPARIHALETVATAYDNEAPSDDTTTARDYYADTLATLLAINETNETTGATYQGRTARQWANLLEHTQAAHDEQLQAVHAKQQRDKANTELIYAVETADGIKHQGSDFTVATQAATLYDDAHVVARTVSTWQRTNPAPTTSL